MQSSKSALRAAYKAARTAQTATQKHAVDAGIAARVLAWEAYQSARTVFLYIATPQEIDTRRILEDAFQRGKIVCAPLCGANGSMTARRIMSESELRSSGAFGILEPDECAEILLPMQIDLVLAPALACDRKGIRLGYGGGYYDRFLPQTKALCATLCAESRLVNKLPREPHDARCDYIITERQMMHV